MAGTRATHEGFIGFLNRFFLINIILRGVVPVGIRVKHGTGWFTLRPDPSQTTLDTQLEQLQTGLLAVLSG